MNGFIVNEDGETISIKNGVGSDGCRYKMNGTDSVYRLFKDQLGDLVDGEFTYYKTKAEILEVFNGFVRR